MQSVEVNVKKQEVSLGKEIIEKISGVFLPVINVLTATAILKGIIILLASIGIINKGEGIYQILYAAADGFFYFLPVFLAYTSAKQFKTDLFVAMAVACALLYPDMTTQFSSGEVLTFFGMRVQAVNYGSSVIPIVLAVIFLHYVEIPLEIVLPEMIKGFFKPILSILIVVSCTFLFFGPIGVIIGDILAKGFFLLYDTQPVLAGAFLGFIMQPMVVVGCHWSIVPVCIANITNFGGDPILPFIGAAALAQGGAALAVALMQKDKEEKRIAFSAVVSALLGVTEPALYGVNLRLVRPMIAACIAGAIGGGMVGLTNARAVSFAFPSFVTVGVYLGEGFGVFLLSMIVGFILGFILTYIQKPFIVQKFNNTAH